METTPNVADGLEIHQSDDGLIVYQQSTDKVHHLNPTASVIFQLCDGNRSLDEIAQLVGELFSLDAIPSAQTATCVSDLLHEKLIY